MSLLIADLTRLQAKNGVKFKSGFLNAGAKKVMTQDVFTLMKNEAKNWQIGNKIFGSEPEKWIMIFKFLTECPAEVLQVGNNYRTNILKEIRNPSYGVLRTLVLNGNNLVSIEELLFFDCPNLENLDLSSNYITTVKALWHYIGPLQTLKLSTFFLT
jgi:hypothetical protein